MQRTRLVFFVFAIVGTPSPAGSAGLAPWQFGMSKEEVTSFSEFGPYHRFANGDLETYAALFAGRKENVQFFFNDTGLRRIGIYLYEGTDLDAGAKKWRDAYDTLSRMYGQIETRDLLDAGSSGDVVSAETLAKRARAAVEGGQKVQLAPMRQPEDLFVFSSFYSREVLGKRYYYVTIYYDPPRNPSK